MLTAPMEVMLKAPDDNRQYWKPFVDAYNDLNRKFRKGKCLYPLNFSYEKVFRKIKHTYPYEVGIRLALRELELRKEVAEKKAEHYKMDVHELNFDDVKVRVDMPLFNTERKGIFDLIWNQTNYHFRSFREFDCNITHQEVFAEIAYVFMKCSTKFDPAAGKPNSDKEKASLNTYLNTAVVNHIRDLWRKRAKTVEHWKEFATLTRILNAGEYPLQIEGKWVAA